MHRIEKFNPDKFGRKNIIPIAVSVFSIVFVGFILISAIEHYIIKHM